MSLTGWSRRTTRGNPEPVARNLASKGEDQGTVVVSHRQGGPLLRFSVILRPEEAPLQPGLLRLVIPFCTSDGIRKDTGIVTWLRWPDEIVVGRKVLATTSMVTGPGINPRWVILTSSIRTGRTGSDDCGGTSLMELLGVEVDPDLLVGRVLESLSWMYCAWSRGMRDHIITRYRSMLDTLGRRVQIAGRGRLVLGVARDVDGAGSLIVELETSKESIRVEDSGGLKEL